MPMSLPPVQSTGSARPSMYRKRGSLTASVVHGVGALAHLRTCVEGDDRAQPIWTDGVIVG